MSDPTRHSSEIVSALTLAAAAAGAALLGAMLGLVAGHRRGKRTWYSGPTRSRERVVWARLSELEATVAERDRALETLKRDYDLDTGLLRQEIQRLELLLGRFSSGRTQPHRVPAAAAEETEQKRPAAEPTYHRLKLIEPPGVAQTEPIPFVPIARYAEEREGD